MFRFMVNRSIHCDLERGGIIHYQLLVKLLLIMDQAVVQSSFIVNPGLNCLVFTNHGSSCYTIKFIINHGSSCYTIKFIINHVTQSNSLSIMGQVVINHVMAGSKPQSDCCYQ